MSKFFLLLIQTFLFNAVCLAAGSLWHGVDDKNGNTTFFLFLDGDRSRVYTPQWKEETELAVSEDRVKFKLPYKTYGITFEGARTKGKLAGSWRIHQVQYVVRGTWTAKEVFSASNWRPWKFLEAKDLTIDTFSTLLKKSIEDFDLFNLFKQFWDKEVEKVYFALFTGTLYADHRGDYRPPLRQERLRQIHKFLRSGKDLLTRNKEFSEVALDIRKTLKEKYAWIKDIRAILVFSGGDFDYRPIRIEDEQFVLLSAEWILGRENEAETKRLLAEALICSFHAAVSPMLFNGQTETVRRSIAAHLLSKLQFEESTSQKTEPKFTLAEGKKGLRKGFRSRRQGFYEAHLTGSARVGTYKVFQEFGRFLATGRSEAELFRLSAEDLGKLVVEFFGNSE